MIRFSSFAKQCFSTTTRVDLLLKNRSVGSRKFIQDLIRQHRVFDDQGNKILSAKCKLPPDAVVFVDDQAVPPTPLLAMYHKPLGELSTMGDPQGRPNLLPVMDQFPFLKTMHPIGRLDSDTSGLLLFSSDGGLTNTLLQPHSGIERVYEATVTGLVDFDQLKSLLGKGVQTSDGIFPAILLESSHIQYDASLSVAFKTAKDFEVTLGPLLEQCCSGDLSKPLLSRVQLSVTEGKHRMVRRILHNTGHSVVLLKRLSYGHASLEDLEAGQCRLADSGTQAWALQVMDSNTSGKSSKSSKSSKKRQQKKESTKRKEK
jgi:23S rRNA pseudouridine2605 synthase